MADKITFSKKINDSVQVGDELWYSDIIGGTPTPATLIGGIIEIGEKYVKVLPNTGVSTPSISVAELAIGGDCESGFTGGVANGWTSVYSHTFAEETTIVHSGSASQKIVATGGGSTVYGGILNTISLVEGEEYAISGWCYSETGDRDLRLLVRDGSNANVYVGPTATVGAGWVEFSDTFVFETGAAIGTVNASCDVMFKVGTSTGMLPNDVYYFDDLSIIDLYSGAGSLFFMFRKPAYNDHTNTSSLKGYHAEVEFTNPSTSKQELFAVGSEVTMSSK